LRRFTSRVLVAALAVVGGYFAAQMLSQRGPAGAPVDDDAAAGEAAAAAVAGLDGNTLVGRVLDTLERRPNIAADFRQSLQIGDDPLSGVGEYWQQGVGNQRRTCWQWTTLVAGQSAAFAQVYDRNGHLWTDKRLSDERTVTRVDLATVRRELSLAADGAGQGGAGEDSQQLELLARGGLSQLIAELLRCFDFGPPVEATVDGRPALAVVGRWRKETLARDWPSLDAEAASDWPSQLPHHVMLLIGPVDRFPYVVEYRRASEADLANAPPSRAADDPLARYEFFNVRYEATMPERLFEFPSTEVEWHDVTGSVVARLRPPPPAPSDATAMRQGAWR
jgi:hypothetical protein